MLHLPPYEQVDYISANHMNMCKFKGRHDDGYEKLLAALNESMNQIQASQRWGPRRMYKGPSTSRFDVINTNKPTGIFAIIPALLGLATRRRR